METRLKVLLLILIIPALFFTSCDKDDKVTSPNNPSIASENWDTIVDQGAGDGTWEFTMKSDSTVTVDGEWTYNTDLYGTTYEVKCPFSNGQVTITGTSLSFTASGTAQITASPSQTSPFTLNVNGTTNNGQANGTWTISFTAQGWPTQLSGTWTGTRTSGSEITQ